MISLFAQLFLAIQKQIMAEVPEIKYIDQDLGQLEIYEGRPAVAWPCVLIDFPDAQYSNHSELVQWADVNISVRLGFAPFSSANSLAPDISKEKALEYYEVENKLYEALQGFTADDCIQPMIRLRAGTETREDAYRVRQMMFTTGTEDDTAKRPVKMKTATLEIEGELDM